MVVGEAGIAKQAETPPSCPEELLEPGRDKGAGERPAAALPDGCMEVYRERELDRFSGLISAKGAKKIVSEYHKEGAPFMGGLEDGAGSPQAAPAPASHVEASWAMPGAAEGRAARPEAVLPEGGAPASRVPEEPTSGHSGIGGLLGSLPAGGLGRAVDVSTVEIAALTVFRALFGQGLAIPIKREGLVDMNVVVMGKDIVINTNRLMLELPELTVWRVVFSYKGRPILEYGRGVPNKIKVHRFRALQLLAGMWWHGLTNHDAQSERISKRALALISKREAKRLAKREARAAKAEARRMRRGGGLWSHGPGGKGAAPRPRP